MSYTQRTALSKETIQKAEASGQYSQSQINYMYDSHNSMKPSDVAWHRSITNTVNPTGSERAVNNYVMHPMDYKGQPPPTWKKW